MKTKSLSVIIGGIGLIGASLSGPTRETDCMTFHGYKNDSDGSQHIIFDRKTYEAGIGFTPHDLEIGKDYKAKLKRYLLGLMSEKIIDAEECPKASSE